jgi:phage/plasmid-like protein (TIGR03299 family)
MAHEIDMSNGQANMAYVGETPWHGLGQQLKAGASIETWRKAAGMDFAIYTSPVAFKSDSNNVYAEDTFPGQNVLYRSDTRAPLAVVSDKYQVVQPKEVLEFYRDLTEKAGFQLETAGVLKGGKKYWALANMGKEVKLLDDTIKGYLLLGTACDGSMATTAMFTSIRVVCNNTLGFAMTEADNGKAKNVIRVNHRTAFDEDKVKAQLGLAATSWKQFLTSVNVWMKTKVELEQAQDYFDTISSYTTTEGEVKVSERTSKYLMELFAGGGKGSELKSANGTVWGLVNAVTEFVDHHRGRTSDVRIDRAWFGDGIATKEKATELANELCVV